MSDQTNEIFSLGDLVNFRDPASMEQRNRKYIRAYIRINGGKGPFQVMAVDDNSLPGRQIVSIDTGNTYSSFWFTKVPA